MGTLGQYLRSAREAKEIDIRDAAQQTRISIAYLNALEAEDFSKLPGEVFVKGFLKNYARFLKLDEAEALKRYAELKPQPQAAPQQIAETEKAQPTEGETPGRETPVEPFVWGAVICIALLFFLFTSFPLKGAKNPRQEHPIASMPSAIPTLNPADSATTEKLYLEIVALQDTWLLVRTDTSPQKKAVLKKGESLIWSADERFLVSYGRVGDVKLLLNGEELNVNGTSETPVRDLAITRNGVFNQPAPSKQPLSAKAKPKPDAEVRQVRRAQPRMTPAAAAVSVSGHDQAKKPASDQTNAASSASEPSAAPAPAISSPSPAAAPEPTPAPHHHVAAEPASEPAPADAASPPPTAPAQ